MEGVGGQAVMVLVSSMEVMGLHSGESQKGFKVGN